MFTLKGIQDHWGGFACPRTFPDLNNMKGKDIK